MHWAGSQCQSALATFQDRLLYQEFPAQQVESGKATACICEAGLKTKKGNQGNEAPSGLCSLMKLLGDKREQHLDLSEYIDPCTCIRLKRKLQNEDVA